MHTPYDVLCEDGCEKPPEKLAFLLENRDSYSFRNLRGLDAAMVALLRDSGQLMLRIAVTSKRVISGTLQNGTQWGNSINRSR